MAMLSMFILDVNSDFAFGTICAETFVSNISNPLISNRRCTYNLCYALLDCLLIRLFVCFDCLVLFSFFHQDAASPRYIFTALQKAARAVFHPDDDALLTYLDDDGLSIEPEFYVPVLPLILVNGSDGIGTGWSSQVNRLLRTVADLIFVNHLPATVD